MKLRLDKALLARGLTESRERAKSLILEGKVLVDMQLADKAGRMIASDAVITLKSPDIPYVGRGGLKLEAALDAFEIDPTGMLAMDVGASTGGFTDCLLQRGTAKVYAIDVGYGQFDWRLRNDERVVLMERTNIRHLPSDALPHKADIAVIDVSFISLKLVVPVVSKFLKKPGGILIALVKPQFEVGKADVGKGGIVRDDEKRVQALESVIESVNSLDLKVEGQIDSPIKGQKGNIEYLIIAREM